MKPLTVRNKCQLDLRLGRGSYGEVYQGHQLEIGEEAALKLEYNQVSLHNSKMRSESTTNLVAAMASLGYTDLFNYCGWKFSLKTVLLLADQLISRFQYNHSKGYIHRDVKPDNPLMGVGTQGNKVYTTDIGLGKEIEDPDRHIYSVVGTLRYASINAHLGKEQSPRDDMESLGYVVLYFLKGSLPWQSLRRKPKEKEKLIQDDAAS